MSGKVKRKFVGELMRFNKKLNLPLKNIKNILPQKYTSDTIISEFKRYYPLLWVEMQERFELYNAKDEFLIRNGKAKRFKPLAPKDYILNLPQIKLWLSRGGLEKHKNSFDITSHNENIKLLTQKSNKIKVKNDTKVKTNTEKIQKVEPLYIDAFIAAYHKKGINTEGKIEILNEIKKYQTKKAIDFLYKLNDSEKNNQVRDLAFKHLQSIGKYVKLRSNFKGKKKDYIEEVSELELTPKDLWVRLEKNEIQNEKRFNFFISHSVSNQNEVLKTLQCLNSQGYVVYCDWTSDNEFLKRGLVSDYTKMVLKKRLDQSENIIFLKSKKALNSEWVGFELEYFAKLMRPIYFIELDETKDERLNKYKLLEYNFEKDFLQNPKEIIE